MGGHAPSASDWHRGKVPGSQQVHGAAQKGDVATDGKHVAIVSRPGKTVSASTRDSTLPDYGCVIENDWVTPHHRCWPPPATDREAWYKAFGQKLKPIPPAAKLEEDVHSVLLRLIGFSQTQSDRFGPSERPPRTRSEQASIAATPLFSKSKRPERSPGAFFCGNVRSVDTSQRMDAKLVVNLHSQALREPHAPQTSEQATTTLYIQEAAHVLQSV